MEAGGDGHREEVGPLAIEHLAVVGVGGTAMLIGDTGSVGLGDIGDGDELRFRDLRIDAGMVPTHRANAYNGSLEIGHQASPPKLLTARMTVWTSSLVKAG